MFDKCYKCGESGHTRKGCPKLAKLPPAEPAPPPAVTMCLDCGMFHTEPCEHIPAPDYADWAARARANLFAATGHEDSPIVRTPFRDKYHLPTRTEKDLMRMAREQVIESRAARGERGPAVLVDDAKRKLSHPRPCESRHACSGRTP